jgi:hypothetical protein
MKACRDCKWVVRPKTEDYEAKCGHSTSRFSSSPNYYHGNPGKVEQLPCQWVRGGLDKSHCGPEAKFWEARE